jgi:hypothetical protein
MANYEQLITSTLQKMKEVKPPSDTYTDNKGWSASNDEKAKKLLGFAEPILREFASQIQKKLRRLSNTAYYGTVDCKARYEFYIPNWLGMKKQRSPTLTITIGQDTSSKIGGMKSCPLVINSGTEYGKHIDIKEIHEEWFISVLTKEYYNMITTPAYYGWR